MRKLLLMITVLATLALLGLAACSSGMDSANDEAQFAPAAVADDMFRREVGLAAQSGVYWSYSGGYVVSAAEEASDSTAAAGQTDHESIAGTAQRHIIQSATAGIESVYFDEAVTALRQLAPSVNGYVESEFLSAGQLTIVMRVPAATFEEVLVQIEGIGEVLHLNQHADDVTDQFYDMRGSLAIRRIEEERVLALIDEATNIQDILALEARLSSIRLIIERYDAQLNDLAGRIAYSTITVNLFDTAVEERIITSPTLGERIGGAFGDSVDGTVGALQGFVVFMAGAVLPLVLLGMVGFMIYIIARKVVLKRRVES